MTILEKLPVQSMLGVPFADYLNVTVPHDIGSEVVSQLLPVIESLGPMCEEEPGLYRLYDLVKLKATAPYSSSKRGARFLSYPRLAWRSLLSGIGGHSMNI